MGSATRRGGRLQQAIVLCVLATALPVAFAGVAGAAPAAPSPQATAVAEGVDYTSEVYADPLDFTNIEDFNPTPLSEGGGVINGTGVSNATVANGIASMTENPGGYMEVAKVYGPADRQLHLGHDPSAHPIDAGRYNRFQVHMFSSANSFMGLFWYDCTDIENANVSNCQGTKTFNINAGWHTYDISIPQGAGGTMPWAGSIKTFRFYNLGGAALNLQYDWMRIAASGTDVNVTIPPGGGTAQEVWWDTDTNPNNNGVNDGDAAGAQRFATNVAAGGTAVFPASGLAPGTYYVFYKSAGGTSDYSTPITVAARPEPVVVDPDVAGGDDYAATVRGDAWDFNQATDGTCAQECAMAVSGGMAHGSSAGNPSNDPQVTLPQVGPIDAALYHRLTYRMAVDGPFSLSFNPGGGMHSRLLWAVDNGSGGGKWTVTNDLVESTSSLNTGIYPDNARQFLTVSVDLKTNPPSAINDETLPDRFGWGGPGSQQVLEVRLRPHEDPGFRTWHIDEVRLARNDRGTPHFNIKFRDNAWKPNPNAPATKAELFADPDTSGFNGFKIATNIDMAAGDNSFEWNGTDVFGNPLPPGTYSIHLKLTDSLTNTSAQAYSTGPVDMPVQPANPPAAPTGVSAVAGPNLEAATVSWTAPLNNGGAPITNYVITVSPGNGKVIVPAGQTSMQVQGLTGGVQHTFTVAAQNSAGVGPPGGPTTPVTPTARGGTHFHPVVPYRVLDSRTPTGGWNAKLGPASTRDVPVGGTGGAGGVPASASAVVLNLTATNGSAGSFATVYPAGGVRPTPSNLNFGAGQTIPNLVTAKLGNNGAVTIYNEAGSADFVADVVGFYDDGVDPTGGLFVGMTPQRLLDSRGPTGGWNAPLASSADRDLVVRGAGTGVPATATAVILNVTATNASQGSFLQVWPTGAAQPNSSNLNFGKNQTIPNLVVVQIGSNDSVSFHNAVGATDVVADVMGYFDPTPGGGFFHAMAPVRVLDDRFGVGLSGPWSTTPRSLQIGGVGGVPVNATGVVMNTTVTGPSQPSFVTVYPSGAATPSTSNLNFGPNETIANLVIVQLPAGGAVDIVNAGGHVDVIGDVSGYYADT